MNDIFTPHGDVASAPLAGLELGMQELEAMEAPGWWTAAGVSAGVVAASAAGYGSYLLTAAAVAT